MRWIWPVLLPCVAFLLASTSGCSHFESVLVEPERTLDRESPVSALAQSGPRSSSITVMTFNVRYGKGVDGIRSLERIVETIRTSGADVVGLQEVDVRNPRSLFEDQVRMLAERLGMYVVYGPTLRWGPARYGNAILSRFPVASHRNFTVPSELEQRGYVVAELEVPEGTLTFVSTHLGLCRSERVEHVSALLEQIGDVEGPLVVVGDWNDTPDSPPVQSMTRKYEDAFAIAGGGPGETFSLVSEGYDVRIDYIFVSEGVGVERAFVIDTPASDHLPVVARLSLQMQD